MSGSNPCTCEGSRKDRMKNWVVTRRNYNTSTFESPRGQRHYSEYSSIACNGDGGAERQYKGCLKTCRSKAAFVENLPDAE